MEHRIDFKTLIENITGLKVYPVVIPNKANYPAIQMTISGGGRDSDSGYVDCRISGYRISLVVCSGDVSVCYENEKLLINELNDKTLNTTETKALIIYFENSVELYNHSQGLYELTLDFSTKLRK